MPSKRILSFGLALLASVALAGPCFANQTFTFQYSFPNPPEGIYNSVSVSGTLTTGDFDASLGGYRVLSIEGIRTFNGVNSQITGLIPSDGFGGNDNVLHYSNGPFLDGLGLSFTIDNPALSNDFHGNVNVFYDSSVSAYTENSIYVFWGSLYISSRNGNSSSAQNPIYCTVSASTMPTARSEGVGEKVGDILISCGNSATPPIDGSAVDRGTLLVDFGVPLTSRADAAVNNVGKPSEIVLMFDEPGAGNGPVSGYGQNAAAIVCTAANAQADQAAILAAVPPSLIATPNCPATLHNVVNGVGSYWVLDSGVPAPPTVFAARGQARNVYQGAIGGAVGGITGYSHTASQVLFYDVPVLPSGAGNLTHLFRIANARVTPGAVATITAALVPATLASGGSPVPGSRWQYVFSGSPVTVGTAVASLTTSVTSHASLGSASMSNLALLTFAENFSGAFKTRVLPLDGAAGGAMGVLDVAASAL